LVNEEAIEMQLLSDRIGEKAGEAIGDADEKAIIPFTLNL
jgi:hypothetical protein